VLLPLYDSACEAWTFSADEEVICGAGKECQFLLNHESIADRHCAFTLRAGTLTIRRLDGRIWLNEIPVSSEAILTPGDILSIGPVTFHVDETARPAEPTPVRVSATTMSASTNHQTPVASAASVAPHQMFQPAQFHAPASFLFAPSLPVSPPPLPAVFVEDHSAKISAAAESLVKERTADIEIRERLLQAREQQLQELELLIRDRERICLDRQSTLDERVQVLGEQKSHLEEQRAQAEAAREHLHQQKLDLERRIRQQTEREDELASQLESSAHGYAQVERTRGELSARLNDIQQRETQLDQQRRELEELASWINSQKAELQASTTAVEYRTAELHSKEAALNDTAADLTERQQSVAARENSLREREVSLSISEQRVAEASLQVAAADTKMIEAERRIAEADAGRIAAEEISGNAERKIQEAFEQLQLAEQARHELDRQRRELESLRQESEAKHALTIQLEEQHDRRAAELNEQSTRLASIQQELETQRQSLNLQLEKIAEQTGALEQRTSQLDLREADLSARVAQLAEDNSSGTRSVEQLMAIAAERESAIRSRQEAARAMDELKSAKAVIADKELAMNARQLEIESRSVELAERVSKLKAARDAVRAREQQLGEIPSQSAFDLAAVHEEHQRLLERQATLTEREARATERENAANVVLRNAEAEREALQMSHKDLICERNALMQFSQDLNSRASGLTERESIVSQQTEELRSRFLAMNQQSSELQRLENELNQRAAELHRRVTQFKAEMRDQKRTVAADAIPGISVDESLSGGAIVDSKREQELTEALQAAESQLNGIQTERDALLTAVRELQRAMLDAREDVEEANRLRTDAAKQEQTLAALYQTIEERSGQLQLLESRLRQSESQAELLQKQLQGRELGYVHDSGAQEGTALNLGNGGTESSELEAELIRQLETLKGELKSVRENSSADGNSAPAVEEQNRTIDELRRQNEALQSKISDLTSMTDDKDSPVSMIQVDELQAQLTRATEVISDRDDLIRELRMRLSQQVEQSSGLSPSENVNAAELQKEARELDRRASLLDAREEEVRERLRMVSNAEEEVESQRRQLLDARQQLEMARTEIQVAMKQHSAVASYAGSPETDVRRVNEEISREVNHRPGAAIFGMETEPVSSVLDESDETSANAALDLRAELASLFGLSARNAEKPEMELSSHEELPDTSEPLGAAKPVALHFGEDASKIVSGHVDEPTPESSGDKSGEDSSDDFVRDYMEQLLSRSRKAAGNSLPSELSGGSKAKSSPATPASANAKKPEAPATKSPPKVKSYIDQYMAGGALSLDNAVTSAPGEAEVDSTPQDAPEAPLVPRVKVDVEKLRQNMDSFRSVSTQSVEKALVTHALRTERLSINGRIFLVCVMGFMSIFFGVANYKGIINYPALIWVTLVGAIGAGLELTRKMYAVKSKGKALVRCEESCAGKASAGSKVEAENMASSNFQSKPMTPVPPPLPASPPALPDMDESVSIAGTTSTSPYAAIAAVTAREELSPMAVGAIPSDESDDRKKDEYFEL
jgi:chromosome segregation ATPase